MTAESNLEEHSRVVETIQHLQGALRSSVMGRDDVIDLVIVGLLTDGHVLLEDYPGSGKTTLAKTLGLCLESSSESNIDAFRRIQFTPDLLPSDVTGVMVFEPERGQFHLRKGPIFAHLVLVDEINRTSPKVQSALLEAMAESQVTIDNTSHDLGEPFMVIATQNPLDSVGTYPLPQAQLDRFLFKISMKHIARECELQVMRTYGRHQPPAKPAPIKTTALVRVKHYIQEKIHLSEAVESCLLDIAEATRTHTDVILGLSTRALVAAMSALKAYACLQGRAYVIPDDIVTLAPHLFGHRLTVKGGAEQAKLVLNDCIQGPVETLVSSSTKG